MRVALLGTGKMARDLGAFYMGVGCEVAVAGREPERLAAAFADLEKRHRRLVRAAPEAAPPPPMEVLLRSGGVSAEGFEADVVIETTTEALGAKRAALEAARPLLVGARAVATNSSSFLPSEIREGLVGVHHFFPSALTGVVEIVSDGTASEDAVRAVSELSAASGLVAIAETASSAFAVNRLLLPLQNEVFRALAAGAPAEAVDAASISPLCASGQLALIDAIGIDVVAASVARYRSRMDDQEARSFADLGAGLEALLAAGRLGKKNGAGAVTGAPSIWGARGSGEDVEALRHRMRAVFLNACARCMERGDLAEEMMDLALDRVFGAELGFAEALRREGAAEVVRSLAEAHGAERLDYLRPSALLSRGC